MAMPFLIGVVNYVMPRQFGARDVIEEPPLDSSYLDAAGPGPVAGGDPPASGLVAIELEGIFDRVTLLYMGWAASAKPVAAMPAGESGAVLSMSSPVAELTSCSK
jgi:hypothetical protein